LSWPLRPGWWRVPLRPLAAVVLGAWAAGLLVAAVQLNAWDHELARTLLQIRADAVFRMRMAEAREPIPREWYRSKTLALLAASEKLQDDTVWALFVPGSWLFFDDLRQRVAARIERAFSDIAVETVRRELFFRASQLTGVPQDPQTAELLVGRDCALAQRAGPDGTSKPGGAPQELPEFVAVQNQLAAIEELDRAAQAMLALQGRGSDDAENLRLLVRYAFGVELPGRLSRSAAYFRTGLNPEDLSYAATGVPRLRAAARCSVVKAMDALDARLFERSDLFAAEAYLAQRAPRLFSAAARPAPFAETVAGYRDVVAALNEQEALLAHADYGWLRGSGDASLGPVHEQLLARISGIGLLGPEAVEQVRRQSAVSAQRFRKQFRATLGAGSDPAVVWLENQGRLVLSAQRLALRDALVALLKEPFMVPPEGRIIPAAAAAPLSWDMQRLAQALAVAESRRRFLADTLPRFPVPARRGIAQFVDAQLGQLVQDAAVQAMRPAGAVAPSFDPAQYRAQREQLARLEKILADLGARSVADKLRALVSHDLVDRLALAELSMWRSSLYGDRTQHFGWWQGEGSPILQAFGATDNLTLRFSLARELGRLDHFGREAGAYLAYADASLASNPTVLRWQGIVAELKRYRAGAADSSLLALERYMLSLGADLTRANCIERLAVAGPFGTHTDEFAQRHLYIHNALVSRCRELRFGPRTSEPSRIPTPFG
jgi:type VI secretion system protein ImpL